jgi:hypothetical protein
MIGRTHAQLVSITLPFVAQPLAHSVNRQTSNFSLHIGDLLNCFRLGVSLGQILFQLLGLLYLLPGAAAFQVDPKDGEQRRAGSSKPDTR